MNVNNPREIQAAAEDALTSAGNEKKLVLVWAAVNAALPLLVNILNFILESQIAQTGGLSGIGLRSILSTVQSGLSTLTSILLPFWSLGYTAAVLRFARREPAELPTMLEGFRRFGPALRLFLLKVFFMGILCIACFYAGVTLLAMTPLADPVWAVLEQSQNILATGVIDEALIDSTIHAMLPMFLICCGLCLIVLTPVFYRLRLAEFCVLDASHRSGLMALLESRKLMHRNRIRLFRLDLQFWWFYLAQLLFTALCYGDVILPAMGVTLPFGGDAAYFIFYVVALAAQFALLYCCSNRVQTAYAIFYDTLRTPTEEETGLTI